MAYMRKFNARESYVIIKALETQRDENVAQIVEAERNGRNCMFSTKYIEDEHNTLIDIIKSNTKILPKWLQE